MRRMTLLFLVTVFVFLGLGAAQAAEIVALSPQTTGLELEEAAAEIIHVRVAEVRLDGVEIDGADWAFVRAPGAQNTMDRGLPSLPYLTSRYLLDRTGGISLELVNRKVRTIDLAQHGFAGVAPSKGHIDRGTDPATVSWIFNDKVYASDNAFPLADSRIGDPFITGPVRGQAIQIPVASWQPDTNTLNVVEEAWFRVVHVAEAANPKLGPDRPLASPFESVVRQGSLNEAAFTSRDNPFVEAGRLLIIADDEFIDEVQPLADWETLVGYQTLLIPVSTAGSTAAEIKSYIQSVYDSPEGLAWIILVGDSDQIPTLIGVNADHADCDACYTKLEGADNRPDAAISRLSAQTGEQVTVQISKILDYERYPDTGGAGSWYTKGFGVSSSQGSPPDTERMNWLRDDLMTPAYTYTEFDQIYDPGATAAQVTAAVNLGRSLGLYIGHGSKTSWSTTGFGVSHINNDLTNADTLPVIWSVACVNGDFVGGSDCFGEAWLKKDGGGAVSFEGATTNESWVPPCIAQRGIVDSIRLETSFTTGGQHMAGKHAIMDEYGDANSTEGTLWVEQSTLFGAVTTWMRTLPAVAPDEPDDFAAFGGTATLTVKVGGVALAKAGAAIVSFYNETGGINVVGSGLIDASGVVTANVTGDPTHCHIHGQNLIPTSFEVAARAEGQVSLDSGAYACGHTVTVLVSDSNVTGSSSATVDTTTVELAAGGGTHTVTLTETAADRNRYMGTAVLGTDLVVSHGDTFVATYVDENDGAGGTNLARTADAVIDCAAPVISGVATDNLGPNEVTVRWTTDEPGTSWAQLNPGGTVVSDMVYATEHELLVGGLDPCTTYTITVTSTDSLGNAAAGVQTESFMTWMQQIAFEDDVEAGVGTWTVDTFVDPGTGTNWSIVEDTATSSPGHSWFTSNEGVVKDDRLEAGPFSLGGGSPELSFWHHFETEAGWDGGVLEVSTDGTTWVDVMDAGGVFLTGGYNDTSYSSTSNPIGDSRDFWSGTGSLQEVQVDLTALAGGDLWICFRFGSDGYLGGEGWWVDDVTIETSAPCSPDLFADDFESGNCGRWSYTVD